MDTVSNVIRIIGLIIGVISLIVVLAITASAEELPAEEPDVTPIAESTQYSDASTEDTLTAIHNLITEKVDAIQTIQDARHTEQKAFNESLAEWLAIANTEQKNIQMLLLYTLVTNVLVVALTIVMIFAIVWGSH